MKIHKILNYIHLYNQHVQYDTLAIHFAGSFEGMF